MVRKASASAKTPYFNWLKDLDRNAKTLEPNSILYFGPFMLQRYPRLRLSDREIGALDAAVLDGKRSIETHSMRGRILKGISAGLQDQLAALLAEITDEFTHHEGHARNRKRVAGLEARAPVAQRKLGRQTVKAREALKELRDYAKSLPPILGECHGAAAEAALKALGAPAHRYRPDPRSARLLDEMHPFPDDPASWAIVRLYWFFRHGCGLSSNESEVRVALIRNENWQPWAEKVAFLEAYDIAGAESMGCVAVRQAVARLPRPIQQGTSG